MLFLLRPRQTWMPYALPRSPAQQDAYNRQQREAYASTHRVAPSVPEPQVASPRDPFADLKALAQLHESGVLTDDEFATEKAKVLNSLNSEDKAT